MIDFQEVIKLLQSLIATQSFSKEEDKTADLIESFLKNKGISTRQQNNNVWAKNRFYTEGLPTILLNSHHDTVRPVKAWTRDPFSADIVNGKLYGLGSNDAGGALVSMIATFCFFYEEKIMDIAKAMLQKNEMTISAIAILLTYEPSNFTKFFKRFEKKTPKQYREEYLQTLLTQKT